MGVCAACVYVGYEAAAESDVYEYNCEFDGYDWGGDGEFEFGGWGKYDDNNDEDESVVNVE